MDEESISSLKFTFFVCLSAEDSLEVHSLRKKTGLSSSGTAAETPVSPARQQQGEQAVAGVITFSSLGSAH